MDTKDYIQSLLAKRGKTINQNQNDFFNSFVGDKENIDLINKIIEYQNTIMTKWEIQSRIDEIKQIYIENLDIINHNRNLVLSTEINDTIVSAMRSAMAAKS